MNADESAVELPIEQVVLSKLRVAAMQVVHPTFLRDLDIEVSTSFLLDSLVFRMQSTLIGKEGKLQPYEHRVTVPNFPRWLPKFLQRRWSKRTIHVIEATPWLIYPEAPPLPEDKWGRPVKAVMWHGPKTD